MKYGYFDNSSREYVIDRIDAPVSRTNYIGVKDLCGVFNHTAGGYLFYKFPSTDTAATDRAVYKTGPYQ